MKMRLSALLLSLAMVTFAGNALAHTRSETHSSWEVRGADVRLQVMAPDLEAARITQDGSAPSAAALGAYIAEHAGVTAGGTSCPRTEDPRPLSSSAGYRRFEIAYRCDSEENMALNFSGWFELVESHTNFAQIEWRGSFVEQLFTKDQQSIDLSDAVHGQLQDAGFLTFMKMGIMHIFTGVDHMSFMLGFVIISRRLRDLLLAITGFTLGHSLTLGLAVTGLLRPDAAFIDALVALTITLIGLENIGDSTHQPAPVALMLSGILISVVGIKALGAPVTLPATILIGAAIFGGCYLMMTGHMRDAGRARLIVTLAFGLIHGFGFASNLLDERLPQDRLMELLFGFNMGVEVGQVTVVLTALLVAHLLKKVSLGVPRPIFTDLAGAFLAGEGLYWFLGRAFV